MNHSGLAIDIPITHICIDLAFLTADDFTAG